MATNYIYLLEHTTDVDNEWVPTLSYVDEALADEVARKNNINTRGIVWAVQEVELVG